MSRNYPYFELVICEVTEPGDRGWVTKADFRTNNVNSLEIPSIATAHTIASLCNIKHYQIKRITEDSFSGEVVFTSPRVAEIEAEAKLADARYQERMFKLAEAINKEPEIIKPELIPFVPGVEIRLKRSKAEFNPRYSRVNLLSVVCEFVFTKGEIEVSRNVEGYLRYHLRGSNIAGYAIARFIEDVLNYAGVDLKKDEARSILQFASTRKDTWKAALLHLVPTVE